MRREIHISTGMHQVYLTFLQQFDFILTKPTIKSLSHVHKIQLFLYPFGMKGERYIRAIDISSLSLDFLRILIFSHSDTQLLTMLRMC